MRWSTRRCQEAESLFGLREWSAARREILALLLGPRLLRLARPASLAIPSQAKDHEPTANCWACPRVRGLRRAPMTELSASESTRLPGRHRPSQISAQFIHGDGGCMKAGIFFGPPRVICVGRLFQVAFSANEESRPVADLRD